MKTQVKQKPGWPSENLRLLLKACLAETGAKQAWQEWMRRRDIDDVNWAELRLLAAFANRIKEIDPDSPEKPRLEGIRRFVWAKNQLRLDRCIQVIDILQNAKIPVMLLKGMGRIATNPSLASSRFVRDIDILIPSDQILSACEILIDNGWRPVNGVLPGVSRAEPFARLVTSGKQKNIDDEDFHVDIHRSVIHYGRTGTFDDFFWTRSRRGQLRGRIVNVPSETDQFLHAIVHATIADPGRPVDWVIDAMDAIRKLDWNMLEMELDKRHAGAAVANTLAYLEHDMGVNIPAGIKKIIRRDSHNPLYYLEVQVYWRLPEERIRYGGVIRKVAEWIRSRHCLYKAPEYRQTLWEGRYLPKGNMRSPEKFTVYTTPIAEYELHRPVDRNENILMIEVEITDNSYDEINIDLLVEGVWFGRLVISPSVSEKKSVIARHFEIPVLKAVPANMNTMNLCFVVLDEDRRVPECMPFRLSACVSYANESLLPRQFHEIEDIYSGKQAALNQVKEACL